MLHRLWCVGVVRVGSEREREFAHLAEALDHHAYGGTGLARTEKRFDVVGGGEGVAVEGHDDVVSIEPGGVDWAAGSDVPDRDGAVVLLR